MGAIILLILILLLIAYLVMFAFANPDPMPVNFALRSGSEVLVQIWQLLVGSLLAGMVLTFLISLGGRSRRAQARREDREELQALRQQLAEQQRKLAEAQAEAERLTRMRGRGEETRIEE